MHVEVIHAKKCARVFHFELRPAVQIGSREFARILQRVALLHGRIDVELQEVEPELGDGFLDPTQCEAVLLDVEKQISAAARIIEILYGCQASQRTPAIDQLQIKSEL